jgi:ketosteroid isomerase-like protein
MHAHLVLFVGLCLAGAGTHASTPAATAADVHARETLVRMENEWLEAKDARELDRILAPDFLHAVAQGAFLTKAQHIAWVVGHPHDSEVQRRLEKMQVRVYGDTAVVTGMVIRSRRNADVESNVFTDVFVKGPQGWQAVSAQETTVP